MENATLRILLADDDEGDRLLFKVAFQDLEIKHTIHMVNNGLQLMDYLKTNAEELPHLIFLDLNMPCKNGLECLKEIRGEGKFKEISIAVYSTSALEKDIEETFSHGANRYIKKPCNFGMLKQLLSKAVTGFKMLEMESCKRADFLLSIK